MRRWSVMQNDYWFTAGVDLEEGPWYLFLLEWVTMMICGWLHALDWLPTEKLRENYGGVGGLFHCHVCAPITDFVRRRMKTHMLSLPYFVLEREFPYAFVRAESLFDEDDSHLIGANRREAEEEAAEYRRLMRRNSFESRKRRRKDDEDDRRYL